jgi:hypothetical protein
VARHAFILRRFLIEKPPDAPDPGTKRRRPARRRT